jgi:hypothetical protein
VTGIDRPAFDEVHRRLAAAGYTMVPADEAWPAFEATRATYADGLEQMANYWAVPTVSWFGGQDPLRSAVHAPGRSNGTVPAATAAPTVAPAVEEAHRAAD